MHGRRLDNIACADHFDRCPNHAELDLLARAQHARTALRAHADCAAIDRANSELVRMKKREHADANGCRRVSAAGAESDRKQRKPRSKHDARGSAAAPSCSNAGHPPHQ